MYSRHPRSSLHRGALACLGVRGEGVLLGESYEDNRGTEREGDGSSEWHAYSEEHGERGQHELEKRVEGQRADEEALKKQRRAQRPCERN